MISNITDNHQLSLLAPANISCHINEKFSTALQLHDAVTQIYGRDLAQLVSNLQNDKDNGTDSSISRKGAALESVVFVRVAESWTNKKIYALMHHPHRVDFSINVVFTAYFLLFCIDRILYAEMHLLCCLNSHLNVNHCQKVARMLCYSDHWMVLESLKKISQTV